MPADSYRQAGAARPGHRLAYAAHIRTGKLEFRRAQNGLVAQLHSVQSGIAKSLGPLGTGPHDAGRPAVGLAQLQPRVDRLWPRSRVPQRVAAGQTDADLHPIGDRGAAGGGEHHRLVSAGGEIPQRVVLAEQLEQAADRGFVLAGQGVLGALGLEQHDCRRHQREGTEEPEERIEYDVRLALEQIGIHRAESDHSVHHIRQPIVTRQRARKQFD